MLEWNEQNRAVGDRHEFRVFYPTAAEAKEAAEQWKGPPLK
jgi:hypothetical protein